MQKTYICHKRTDLINDYLRVVDYYLYFDSVDPSSNTQYKTFTSKVRLNNDESDKFIQVTLIAFRSFLCIKRDFVSGETESEATLFKTITGQENFSSSIDIYYSNIGQLVTRLDGVDIYYASSQIVLGFEFREVKEKQDFLHCLKETANTYCYLNIVAHTEGKVETSVHSNISAKQKSRLFGTYRALKVRSLGCAHEIELGLNETYIFEMHNNCIVNR